MNKCNIFVYIELAKLVAGLKTSSSSSKESLLNQASYFNLIPPKYFSDSLRPEWERLVVAIKRNGPLVGEEGYVIANAVVNTINTMSEAQCTFIVGEILDLYEKVRLDFEQISPIHS